MRWRFVGRAGVSLGCLWVGLLALPSRADDLSRTSVSSSMKAYVDPQTGALVPEATTAPPAAIAPEVIPPLVEVPAPEGGMMVDLQGRFMSSLVATIDAGGNVRIDCVTGDGPGGVEPQQ